MVPVVVELGKENEDCLRARAWRENQVIELMVALWKGMTDEGLCIIINKVKNYKILVGSDMFRPRDRLLEITYGYNGAAQETVDQWFNKNYGNHYTDYIKVAEHFRTDMRPNLALWNHFRIEKPHFASKEIHGLFTAAIEGHEQDFYPLEKIESLVSIHPHDVVQGDKKKSASDRKSLEKDLI